MNARARRVCRWLLALPLLLGGVVAAQAVVAPVTLSAATFEGAGAPPRA